ncbi:Flp pilus assembly complex ATPase component TadA [Thermodesulfovibrionales bacterium]|nr:Flp pilus assembly complex ATPase component TadA [Thermodesulfovibrionales bacterium]
MNRKPITAIEKDMKIEEYLRALVERGGSDLHLKVGRSPLMRIEGDLHLTGYPLVRKKEMEEILSSMLTGIQRKRLEEELELDFSYVAENMARFRVNMFYQLGTIGAVMRIIPSKARGMDDLGLPEVLKEIALSRQGLILITGPTGSGKTTTLAAIIDYLNRNVQKHIVTIEDPVEYIIEDQKCTINQREVGIDTRSFSEATKRAMRQDPDIILVGEMRDPETIHAVLSAADTGHLALRKW